MCFGSRGRSQWMQLDIPSRMALSSCPDLPYEIWTTWARRCLRWICIQLHSLCPPSPPQTHANGNVKTSFVLEHLGFRSRDSSRHSVPFGCSYASRTPIWTPTGQKTDLGTWPQTQFEIVIEETGIGNLRSAVNFGSLSIIQKLLTSPTEQWLTMTKNEWPNKAMPKSNKHVYRTINDCNYTFTTRMHTNDEACELFQQI